MEYDRNQPLADFARRTIANLERIREIQSQQAERPAYEVTHLINSLLGLLVFPREHYIDEIPNQSIDDLKRAGWPIPNVVGDGPSPCSLPELVRYLRNSIAHFNVEFLTDSRREICGLVLWNEHNKKVNWKATYSLQQLEETVRRFAALITGDQSLLRGEKESGRSKISWRRAFIRSGFNVGEVDGAFDLQKENAPSRAFHLRVLSELGLHASITSDTFKPPSADVDESAWLGVIERLHGSTEAGSADMDHIDLRVMDTYMAGIVRWLNAAGLSTMHSCDGHLQWMPELWLSDRSDGPLLDFVIQRFSGRRLKHLHPHIRPARPTSMRQANSEAADERAWLLDLAEQFHDHVDDLRSFFQSASRLAETGALASSRRARAHHDTPELFPRD